MAFIEVHKLAKHYDLDGVSIWALRDINLTIERGEFIAIIGPSGSGKSTLMHLLGLLDSPSAGRISFDNQDVSHLSEEHRAAQRSQSIGFIFQQFNLLARTSSLENVMLPTLYHPNKASARERAAAALERVGLGDRLEHFPNQLSGGQQQRVAIARALINDPDIIFADEPTGNLDTTSGKEVMKILDELAKSGKTVVMVTHEHEVAAHANRVIMVRDGLIVADESTSRGRSESLKSEVLKRKRK